MKYFKRFLFSSMGLATLLFLSGCVGRDKAGNPSGLIWDVIGQPMADGIQFFAKNSGLVMVWRLSSLRLSCGLSFCRWESISLGRQRFSLKR